MHGRKKEKGPISEEKRAATLAKIEKFKKLRDDLFRRHQDGVYDEESLKLSSLLLEINPDFYTLWNFRRRILLHIQNPENIDRLRTSELAFAEECIKKNPKSYSVWFHRKWLVEGGGVDLNRELMLCSKFLDADERNFHCWGYRRFVEDRARRPVEELYAFTTNKIEQNFSNYSAWHYRSKALPVLHGLLPGSFANQLGKTSFDHLTHASPCSQSEENSRPADPEGYEKAITSELDWVKQAFYTDPDDQSAWMYYRWLLRGAAISEGVSQPVGVISDETLQEQVNMCDELLGVAPDSKWTLLTKAHILKIVVQRHPDRAEAILEEVRSLITTLEKIDPDRAGFYQDFLASASVSP